MTDEQLDDLARHVARPMGRRRVLTLMAVSAAATALPGIRPRQAIARHNGCFGNGDVPCGPDPVGGHLVHNESGNEGCCYGQCCPGSPRARCCRSEDSCSTYRDGTGACCSPGWAVCPGVGCCSPGEDCVNGTCVAPCDDGWTRCGPDCCPPGVPCKDGVCQTNCPPERLCSVCCAPGEYCDKKKNRCCPPNRNDTCMVPEPACKKKVDDFYTDYASKVCRNSGGDFASNADLKADAFFALSCVLTIELTHRPGDYARCPQVPSDAVCGAGARCDPGSGLCKRPDCSQVRFAGARAAMAELFTDDGTAWRDERPVAGASAGRGTRLIRKRLRKHRRRLRADHKRVLRTARSAPARVVDPQLAAAVLDYRKHTLALRREIAALPMAARGDRRAQTLVVSVLDDFAAGLRHYARGLETSDLSAAGRHGRTAQKRMQRAGRRSIRARRALGCGTTC